MIKKGFLTDAQPSTQLFFVGLVVIGSWIVFQLIGMFSGMFLFQLSFNEIAETFQVHSDQRMIGFLKYVQAFTSVGMFIVSAIVAANYIDSDWKTFLGLREKPELQTSLMAVAFIIVILPFTNFITDFNTNLHLPEFLGGLESFFRVKEVQMSEIMESLLKPTGIGGLFINILVIAIIPAVGEELTFRGLIQKLLQRWFKHPHWAIIVTAFLFSAMHVQFLSFLPRFFLGLVLGYLFYWSGSIWLSILMHFINNAMAVVFYHYYYGGQVGNGMETIGTPDHGMPLALAGFSIGLGLLYFIYKKYQTKKNLS